MNDSCLGKQVERCPWPSASLIFILVHTPPPKHPVTPTPTSAKHLMFGFCMTLNSSQRLTKSNKIKQSKQNQHRQSRVRCLGTSFQCYFFFFFPKRGSEGTTVLCSRFSWEQPAAHQGEYAPRCDYIPSSPLWRESSERDLVCEEWQVHAAMATKPK